MDATGSLQMGVAFPKTFQVQAVPAETQEIRIGVKASDGFHTTVVLSKDAPRKDVNGLRFGEAQVGAIAFDAKGKPLAGARSVAIVSLTKARVELVLSPGAFDAALFDLVGFVPKELPSPSPSSSDSAALPLPSADASPANGGPSGPPSAGPTPTPGATPTPTPFPTSTPLPLVVGGGALATPTPIPTPSPSSAGGVTVVPGAPYSGPVTVLP